ncbi:hypothetical protein Rsub_09454 [Raphidocelis subcapitata]|uniref:Uncharacterized protein n=1 Tax=Raphidocelis subcapitata TaxID=307507 RepID=A0A2V0PCN9_9CHLO|nr:hypothetical protein Rsub_09454 [Raphidocelis subcapitata]|eukprot:GBF96712.1 hypothetical protein Rsub_09454 [Raphidocelis subcapitata]
MSMMQASRAFAPAAGRARVTVVARATKTATKPGTAKAKAGTTKTAPKAAAPKKDGNGLAVLAKVQELGLLSKVQELGLLSKLEASGLTLSKIEESGLLTQLEKSGLLKTVSDKSTPGALSALGYVLIAAAAAVVYLVGDDTAGDIALQAFGALALGGAGVAAIVGSGLLADLQKIE